MPQVAASCRRLRRMIGSDPGAVPNNPPVFWLLLDFSPKNKGRGFFPGPGLHLRAIESGCKQMLSSAKTFPLSGFPKKAPRYLLGKSQEDRTPRESPSWNFSRSVFFFRAAAFLRISKRFDKVYQAAPSFLPISFLFLSLCMARVISEGRTEKASVPHRCHLSLKR